MTRIIARIRKTAEEGASMAEYGLLLALIAVVAMAGATAVGQGVLSKFNEVAGAL
jgi:pilus assembly protein Flp/PilA